jgi:hypothetical protein
MKPRASLRKILLIGCLVWLPAVGDGLHHVWAYENSPGRSGNSPAQWPSASYIRRNDLPTLVLFIHPYCPCSRATLGEFAILMTHSQRLVNANAVFVKPTGFDEAWEQSDLWRSAMAIPGVTVTEDENAVEAGRFGSETSGQVALYSAAGALLFSGGITGSGGDTQEITMDGPHFSHC